MVKYNVLQVAPKLDLGGTEKTLQVFSQHLNKDLFNVIICGWVEGGARAEQLEAEGFKVHCTNNDKEQLIKLMQDENIQIVHVHRSGFGDNFVIEAAYKAGVPVILETNVFGRIDETFWERYIDCHLFISKTCALRYKHWEGLSWECFFERHRILYYPINLSEIDHNRPSPEKIAQLKRQYKIPLDAPVVGRIGRPDPAKWPSLGSFETMLCQLVKATPSVKIVLMGTPCQMLANLLKRRDLYDKIVSLDPSPRTEKVLEFYSMIDVLIHSAKIGESFGLVIAEAMALAKPVVSKSTPLHDNAQVELIDHGSTGFITYNEIAMAQATTELLLNREKRDEMGLKARKKVETSYDVDSVTTQLENLYLNLLKKKEIPVDRTIMERYSQCVQTPSQEEIIEFEQDYKKRIRTCWGYVNWLEILGYEYLFRYHFPNKMVRRMKKVFQN